MTRPQRSSLLRRAAGVILLAALASAAPRAARAQGDDSSVVEARARFREGVTLYDQGKYEAARAKFKQAYALKQHPDVLLNLGWSSLKSGHPQEAEESFQGYLRDAKDAPAAKRAEAEKGLAQAREASGGSGAGASKPPATPGGAGGAGGASGAGGDASPNATPTLSGGGGGASGAGAAAGGGTPGGAATPATDAHAGSGDTAAPVKEPIRIDALLGYVSDNLNAGIGVRGGKVITQRLYIGGTFVYQFGTSQTYGTNIETTNVSTSLFYLGPEVGWDFLLAPAFTLRAYGGLGFASFNYSVTYSNKAFGQNTSGGDSRLLFWPGVTALYDIPGTTFMVGGDARLLFVPGTSTNYHNGAAFGVFLTGGIRL